MERLVGVLEAVGKAPEVLAGADGTRVVVLPHGGRVLGLFAGGRDGNFLWTNPALHNAGTARAFLSSGQWCNTGGDRTWLAPEAGFFLPEYPATETYFQPRALDPGQYRCIRDGNAVRLENRLSLHSYRTAEDLDVTIVRQVEPGAGPLPALGTPDGLDAAGYTLRTSLELSAGSRTAVGLWSLLQMPHGGEMLIPAGERCEPRVFFGTVPAADLVVQDRLVRFAMHGSGDRKIGIRASAVTGLAGYAWQSGQEWCLVVRRFDVDPAGLYADFPWNDPDDTAYAFQACSVSNRSLGSFGELEYHVPAIGGETGSLRCEDVSRVWAFRGEKPAIAELAGQVLGAQL